ncbi:MAG: ATP-binding cassette domain-containing protein [Tissierellia bacterium]|nr:ATP-binding cassette domain-containing protein [Tissierellia bacterium]
MLIINASELSKSYTVKNIFESVSFSVSEGDRIGLVGLNGTGKTTLFNILAGELQADNGSIHFRKDLNIGYLKQHVSINSNKTVFKECHEVFNYLVEQEKNIRELELKIAKEGEKGYTEELTNLMDEYAHLSEDFAQNRGYSYISEIKGTLKGLGFTEEDFEKKISYLSGGEKTRVELAKLLLKRPELLLMDEPTNHLDIQATEWLEKYLSDYRGTIIIISHDRYFLDKIIDKVFLMENKKLYVYNGNYTVFQNKRKKDLKIQLEHYENQQEEIKRQKEIIKRFIKYGGERYNRLAKSRQKMLDKMDIIDKPENQKKASINFSPKVKSGRNVFEVSNLSKSFGDNKLFEDVNFSIYRGDKIGLIGPNGVGKTTLFNIMLGKREKTSGTITKGIHVNIGFYEQEMTSLNPYKTIFDEIIDDFPKLKVSEIRSYLGSFMFYGDDCFKEIKELSGGEKARISLLKLMLSDANTLFMDEPTNHLDIDSKEVLEDALKEYTGTLFVISHDRYFLNSVVDKIFDMSKSGIQEYFGNYEYYIEKKEALLAQEEYEEIEVKTKTEIQNDKRKERELREEKRKIDKKVKELEKDILSIEERIKSIDEELCKPEIYENINVVKALNEERQDCNNKLEVLYDDWLELKED